MLQVVEKQNVQQVSPEEFLRQKVIAVRDDIKQVMVERNEELDILIRCILSRSHMFLLGAPGNGKTHQVDLVVARIIDSVLYKRLMRPDSAPEEFIGPLSLNELEHDRYRRVLSDVMTCQDGTKRAQNIVRAHFAVIDEAGKCNSVTLNSALDILNERRFQNGPTEEKADLISAIMMSNEKVSEAKAFWSRCTVRKTIGDIQERQNFERLIEMKVGNIKPTMTGATITLSELLAAIEFVKQVKWTPDMSLVYGQLRDDLHSEGIFADVRRWVDCIPYVKAAAWIDGRNEVEQDDLMVLADCLWEEDEAAERPKIVSILGRMVSPEIEKILELLDGCDKAVKTARAKISDAGKVLECVQLLRTATASLKKLMDGAKTDKVKKKAQAASEKVRQWNKEMLKTLGMEA